MCVSVLFRSYICTENEVLFLLNQSVFSVRVEKNTNECVKGNEIII